ncbi:MAG: class I SAM-dependent methyltransferase [Alphaproteobacteria bacterium]
MNQPALTPLARLISAQITQHGPMGLDRYMALCLGHPEHGYYKTRDPFGRGGDFVTAPEISQMFGEILGLWCADMWEKIGRPTPVGMVELGPGRGTLMADMLRAAQVVPAFARALNVHLVETSQRLRAIQRETLSALSRNICWHDQLGEVPQMPMLLLANELFDALPVHQLEMCQDGWHERVVTMSDKGALTLVCAGAPAPPGLADLAPSAAIGAVVEVAPARNALAAQIGQRLAHAPGGALIIDYGHEAGGHEASGLGDTFQAVAAHAFVSPFDQPGEADLTTHVDFHALRAAAISGGASAFGPMAMGEFLQNLGLGARAAHLSHGAPGPTKNQIAAAYHRLTDTGEMGSLFKVLALTGPGIGAPAPFGEFEPAKPSSEPT